jgi:hypothetical protein
VGQRQVGRLAPPARAQQLLPRGGGAEGPGDEQEVTRRRARAQQWLAAIEGAGHGDRHHEHRGGDDVAPDDGAGEDLGRRQQAVIERVDVDLTERPGHGHQGVQRPAPHGGDVAHVDGERLPPHIVDADEVEIEMHAADDRIGGEQQPAGWSGHDRSVVADGGQTAAQPLDEGELAGQRSLR